jgi:hypothetical protein
MIGGWFRHAHGHLYSHLRWMDFDAEARHRARAG